MDFCLPSPSVSPYLSILELSPPVVSSSHHSALVGSVVKIIRRDTADSIVKVSIMLSSRDNKERLQLIALFKFQLCCLVRVTQMGHFFSSWLPYLCYIFDSSSWKVKVFWLADLRSNNDSSRLSTMYTNWTLNTER